MSQCDFCTSTDVLRFYPCRSFDSDSAQIGITYHGEGCTLHSIDEWAACPECAVLIDAKDLDGLVTHALKQYRAAGYIVALELAQHIRYTHQLFFQHRLESTS
jgi:hypothetical protein